MNPLDEPTYDVSDDEYNNWICLERHLQKLRVAALKDKIFNASVVTPELQAEIRRTNRKSKLLNNTYRLWLDMPYNSAPPPPVDLIDRQEGNKSFDFNKDWQYL